MSRLMLVLAFLVLGANDVWANAQTTNHSRSCCNQEGGGCRDEEGLPLAPCGKVGLDASPVRAASVESLPTNKSTSSEEAR